MNMEQASGPFPSGPAVSRREMLRKAAGTSALGALALAGGLPAVQGATAAEDFSPQGRIQHSIVHWCFQKHWDVEQTCRVAQQLGCRSVELVPPEHWKTLRKYNLACALTGSHLFVQGMNNPKYQPMCLELLRKSIDNCAGAGFPTVITFTGFAQESGEPAGGDNPDLSKLPENRAVISPEDGIRNCVEGFKKIVGYAEQKKINLSLEMLNSRVETDMKGHPGYQGDHIDYCMEILKQVGSPRLGLLFDVYHVQIMDGDLIRRIHQCKDVINHVHTAGNPGRCELDDQQEINYPPVMKALVDIGYKGYVGHEFIPTRDPLAGLKQAVQVCDV